MNSLAAVGRSSRKSAVLAQAHISALRAVSGTGCLSAMSAEQRQFKRVLAQRLGGCDVRLHSPRLERGILADISVGGMKILIETDLPDTDIQVGNPVSGEINNSKPAFQMAFSGAIAWSRRSTVEGEQAIFLGLRFTDYTPLPDALMHLIEQYD